MNEDLKAKLTVACDKIRELRRYYSAKMDDMLKNGTNDLYYIEDTMRMIGTLEAAYVHSKASLAGDGDLHCIVSKHLPYALILAGETGEDAAPIYEIMGILTDGAIDPCVDCRTDEKEGKK